LPLQVDKVKAATALVKEARPDLFVEGEQAGARAVPSAVARAVLLS